MKISGILILLAPALTFCQSPSGGRSESYIARTGKTFISESEFLERFELSPGFGKRTQAQLDVEKLEFMYSIVAEKLLAQEAVERGMDRDTLVQAEVLNVRKLLARDELFRREVAQMVRISPKEIADGMRKAQRELLLKYVFFENEDDARFVRKRLTTIRDFDLLKIDSTISALRDTVTLVWGDADPSIETAAYRLKKGEVSPIVNAGNGFYILTIATEKTNQYYNSMQPAVFRERVEERLRLRKEKTRMEEFVRQLMSTKTAYGRPAPLKVLSEILSTLAEKDSSDSTFVVTPGVADQVREMGKSIRTDSLVVIGNEVWSLDSVLDRLVATGFSFKSRNSRSIFSAMNYQLKIWTQQEVLAQEGLGRGLDQTPSISEKIEMWHQHFLAEALKIRVQKGVSTKSAEIWSYLADRDKNLNVPTVQIRLLRTNSLPAMNNALDDLASGKSFETVVRERSDDPKGRQQGGLTDFFPITNTPFGPIAWEMKVGERQGPQKLADGFYLFELVDKKVPPATLDTSFVTKYEQAAKEYAKLKQQGVVSAFLANLGGKFGFAVFEDRLKQIKVSSVPMVTYRILGFGGRMFEVPFVDRQTDWLGIDASQSQTIQ